MKLALLVASVALLPACTNEKICSLEARAGISLTVRDAATKKPVCDANVVFTEGDFRETAEPFGSPDCIYHGVYERKGTYKIEVTHPTLKPATREGVKVEDEADGCHVAVQKIEIELSGP